MAEPLAEQISRLMAAAPAPRARPAQRPLRLEVQAVQPSLWKAPLAARQAPVADVAAPRRHLCRALEADLIGPYALDEAEAMEQELLTLPPSRYYLTGFLAPDGERDPGDVGQDEELAAGSDEDEEETQNA